jgi:putative restriction endonuclease
MTTAEQWLGKLAKLNINKAKRPFSPHKPLLLLILLELVEENKLPGETLVLTPELAYRFCTYWSIVAYRQTQPPDVRYPFYHLKRDGFWTPLDADGRPAVERRLARTALMPLELVATLQDMGWRKQARHILIAKYFEPAERAALYTLVGLPIPSEDQIALDAAYESPDTGIMQGRETRFRLSIVAAYNYTCALTGYRLNTVAAGSIVDAAHIHQFSTSRNNDPRNGLALCKNAHWLFDNGLWTLTDDFKVVVAKGEFAEDAPNQKSLIDYDGQKIHLPTNAAHWPSAVHMAWHRRERFKGQRA